MNHKTSSSMLNFLCAILMTVGGPTFLSAQGIQPLTAEPNREKNFFNALEKLLSMNNLEAILAEYEAAKSSQSPKADSIKNDLKAQVNGNEAADFLLASRLSADPLSDWEKSFGDYIKGKEGALTGKTPSIKSIGPVTALLKARVLYRLSNELASAQKEGKDLKIADSIQIGLFSSQAEINRMKALFGAQKIKISDESGIGYVQRNIRVDQLGNVRPKDARTFEFVKRDGSIQEFVIPDDLDDSIPKPANLNISLRPRPGFDMVMVINYPLRLKDFAGKSVVVVDEIDYYEPRDAIGDISIGASRTANTKAIYVDSADRLIEAIQKSKAPKKSSDATRELRIEEFVPRLSPKICQSEVV